MLEDEVLGMDKYQALQTVRDKYMQRCEALESFLKAIGFDVEPFGKKGGGTVVTSRAIKKCRCGGTPRVEAAVLESGKWLVRCDDCCLRAASEDSPVKAVKAWNAGEVTEGSNIVSRPLVHVDADGDLAFRKAIARLAVSDFRSAERVGDTHTMKKIYEFFETSPLMENLAIDRVVDALRRAKDGL